MIRCSNKKLINVRDWDDLVQKTYKKPYSFQQQEGCQSRGTFNLTIPTKESMDDEMHDSIPEEVNGEIMGVKFKTWLARNPKQTAPDMEKQWKVDLFWERNFYPDIFTVANDLHKKGLIEAGEYVINIDW